MFRSLFLLTFTSFFSKLVSAQALLVPPAAFASVGSVTTMTVGTASNMAGGYVMSTATLNLGARTVTVPIAMRIAANASIFAATKMNPYVAAASLAVAAYPVVEEWFSRDTSSPKLQISPQGKIILPAYESPYTPAQVNAWPVNSSPGATVGQIHTPPATCASGSYSVQDLPWMSCSGSQGPSNFKVVNCFNGWSNGWSGYFCSAPGWSPAPTSVLSGPAPQPRIDNLGNTPIKPSLLPFISPDIPVDPVPVINPSTAPVGDPFIGPDINTGPLVQSSPFRVPNGEPVPIPNSVPPSYTQPWYEIVPNGTPFNPWSVQVNPITTVVSSPNTVIPLNPANPSNPVVIPTDCQLLPLSLGCSSLDTPAQSEQIPKISTSLSLQSAPTFSAGSCPPDLVISAMGRTFFIPTMSTACGWIQSARPIIILLAFLSAITIVRPGRKPTGDFTNA